jgi:hypothetical protein
MRRLRECVQEKVCLNGLFVGIAGEFVECGRWVALDGPRSGRGGAATCHVRHVVEKWDDIVV